VSLHNKATIDTIRQALHQHVNVNAFFAYIGQSKVVEMTGVAIAQLRDAFEENFEDVPRGHHFHPLLEALASAMRPNLSNAMEVQGNSEIYALRDCLTMGASMWVLINGSGLFTEIVQYPKRESHWDVEEQELQKRLFPKEPIPYWPDPDIRSDNGLGDEPEPEPEPEGRDLSPGPMYKSPVFGIERWRFWEAGFERMATCSWISSKCNDLSRRAADLLDTLEETMWYAGDGDAAEDDEDSENSEDGEATGVRGAVDGLLSAASECRPS
jgi:hypothetical protein